MFYIYIGGILRLRNREKDRGGDDENGHKQRVVCALSEDSEELETQTRLEFSFFSFFIYLCKCSSTISST